MAHKISPKPTLRLRLILGTYSGVIGLIALLISSYAYNYYTYRYVELDYVIANISLTDFIHTPGHITFGFFLLPNFISHNHYRPGKAFLGGVVTFATACLLGMLLRYSFLGIREILLTTAEVILPLPVRIYYQLDNILAVIAIPMTITVAIGGVTSLFINKALYSRHEKSLPNNAPLWTETLLSFAGRAYEPSRLNPQKITLGFRLFTAGLAGLIALLIPTIFSILMAIFFLDQPFNAERDLSLGLLMLVPGELLVGFLLLPHYLALTEYRPVRSFFGGMLTLGLTTFVTAILYTLYKVPFEDILSWTNPDANPSLTIRLLSVAILIFAISLVGGIVTWPVYRRLFVRRDDIQHDGLSIFD